MAYVRGGYWKHLASIAWMTVAPVFVLAFGAHAQAASVSHSGTSSGGHAVSGTLDITLETNKATVVVTNTTEMTYGPAELLTAFEIRLQGFDPLDFSTLTSAQAAQSISVAGDGTFTQNGAAELLLALNTWSDNRNPKPGVQLDGNLVGSFVPNAEYAIIGTEEGDGDYSMANGGINNNDGHNPFIYKTATFVFELDGITTNTQVERSALYFGTAFETHLTIVPLPATAWMGMAMLGGLGVITIIRRRRLA